MPQFYITNDERYLLEWINGHFDIRNNGVYPIRPVARELIEDKGGYDQAIDLLNHVLFQIDKRRNRAKSNNNIYVLDCYYQWVWDIKADVQTMRQNRLNRMNQKKRAKVMDVKAFVQNMIASRPKPSAQASPMPSQTP